MVKIRDYLYCLVFGLGVVYFQKNFFFDAGNLTKPIIESSANFLLFSLGLGITFGFISCPVCGLPLSLALGSTEKRVSLVIFKNILFNLARFLIIFIYAFLGSLAVKSLEKINNLSWFLGGLIMVVIGLSVLSLRVRQGTFSTVVSS